jgi:hypothetical protein
MVISTVASLFLGLKSVSAEYASVPGDTAEAASSMPLVDASLPS